MVTLSRYADSLRACAAPLFAVLLLVGCASASRPTSSTTPAAGPAGGPADSAPESPTIDQQMAALSFIAYTGEAITGPDPQVSKQLAPCFVDELKRQPLVSDWELVWGPVVYRFDVALYNDNLLYAVRRRDDPSTLAVVVRGTNGPAALDWLVEDFSVFKLRSWPYGSPPSSLEPKISEGTHIGLDILQKLVPSEGEPGAGKGMRDFLAGIVGDPAHDRYTVYVTGHSLGGALSPPLALWLADTAGDWDPKGKASLEIWAYAGPTPGDGDFSTYYDQRLGGSTHRVHNALGVPPRAWNAGEMARIPDLYLPVASLDDVEKLALKALIVATEDKDFQHVAPDAPPMSYQAVNPSLSDFFEQVGWQHHCGYLCGVGIRDTFLPVSSDCKTKPKDPCPVCP